ncbi:rhodanese-like domain-containing protein [Hymenobacter sp. HMF4947]|uniref:Rhodanese-like domain-containing protein n=1 Tax=Hymenobacter ginkgonis TaxID=2682976 RepID=A0A7K1TB95_9BACT|nr:rhodanese-like domain-containing protein [Hymenobacter ginkgonis]MVN75582.1 rhodanese-like domain-containing protein [Hymenobacter ginkgonis]
MKPYPLLAAMAWLPFAVACNQQQPAATAAPTTPAPAVVSAATPTPVEANHTAAARQVLNQPGTVVLDVRTPLEFMTGHLPQARNLSVGASDFTQQVAALDTSRTYVLYCGSGQRSGEAALKMQSQGFHHLINGGAYDDLKAK